MMVSSQPEASTPSGNAAQNLLQFSNQLAAVIVDTWQGAQVRAKTEQSDKALKLFLDSTFNFLLRTSSRLQFE